MIKSKVNFSRQCNFRATHMNALLSVSLIGHRNEKFKERYPVDALEVTMMGMSEREDEELWELVNLLDATPYHIQPKISF